ncbi:MAG: hypothetical protein HJHJAOHD_00376 [Flavobacteriales bacterium]|nr:hypothetical protein [Flavobacteriales bacterium]WKZ74636.1 MAG: DUF2341 domain-containing protein [Vicingaceae bacterium]
MKAKSLSSRIALPFFLSVFMNNVFSQTCMPCKMPFPWQYADAIIIDNSANPVTLTDYQILLTYNTQAPIGAGKMKANGDDIRFTSDCSDTIYYWIESGINTPTTQIWVRVPLINANSIDTLLLYYGNPNATAFSNGDSTFMFFDDFSLPNLNLSKWQVQGNPTYSINSGILTFSGNSNWEYIRSTKVFNQKVVVEENHANGGVSTGLVLGYTGTHQRYSFRANGANLSTTYDNDIIGGNTFFSTGYPAVPASNNQNLFYKYKVVTSINTNIITVDSYCNVTTSNCDNAVTALNTYTGSSFYVGFTSYSPSYTGYLDWIRVRKHSAIEPIATQGNTFLALPVVNLGNDTTVCGELLLDAGPGFTTYTWSPSGNNQVLIVNATGTYSVVVTENTGCKGSDTINVTVNPLPNAGIIAPSSYCTTSPSDTLDAITPGGTWSGTGIIDNINGVFDPATAGLGAHTIYYSITDTNNCSNTDSVEIDVIICTGITENNKERLVSVYPNPSNDIVNISFTESTNNTLQIQLFDVTGKEVYNKVILKNTKTIELDFSHIQKGLYSLRLVSSEFSKTEKISLK